MLVVLSPAKNLDYKSEIPKLRTTQPQLLDEAGRLIEQLRPLSGEQLSALMRISEPLGELNHERFQSWRRPFTASNARAAVLAFDGDVYRGLAAASWTQEDFAFAQRHLRILSGLYGLLRPLDLMQPYRLEMGTGFANERGKNLYEFWGDIITDSLNAVILRDNSHALVNLASKEYFRSVKPSRLKVPVIEPVFKEVRNGNAKVISFFAKKARGQMAAYIVKNRLCEPEALRAFNWDGYKFQAELSDERSWVFTRQGDHR